MLAVDFDPTPTDGGEPLTLLIHLMSAGRLRLYDKRDRSATGPRGCSSGSTATGNCGCASSGPSSRPGRSCFGPPRSPTTRRSPPWAPTPGRLRRSPSFAALIDQPRHLHPLLRHQRDIAGIGRSWVDEILWEARLSPSSRGRALRRRGRAATRSAPRARRRARALRGGDRREGPRQTADAAQGAPPARASRALAAGPRSRPCSSPSIRPTTAKGRPAAGCSRTAASPGC